MHVLCLCAYAEFQLWLSTFPGIWFYIFLSMFQPRDSPQCCWTRATKERRKSQSQTALWFCAWNISRENDEELWCGISQLLLNVRPPESCACCRWGWGSLLPVVCDSGPDRFPPCRPPCSFSLACLLFSQHTWFMNQTKNQTDDPLRIVSAASLRWVASAAN